MTATTRVLLVGEAPSRAGNPAAPLSGRVGARLEALAGVDPGTLRQRFDCVNLLSSWPGAQKTKGARFPMDAAEGSARRLRALLAAEPAQRRVVYLGKRVARAFGERKELVPCVWYPRTFEGRDVLVALVPHPSGVNRWWNDPKHVKIAESFLRNALQESK